MRTRNIIAVVVAAVALVSACTGNPMRSARQAAPDLNVITRDQIQANHFHDAYEAVAALRSNWLQARGPDSFVRPSHVQVYLDDMRMGGIDWLKTLSASTISYVRHYDGLEATSRWGVDHGAGVIFVSTRVARTN